VTEALAGSPAAFERIVRRYQRAVVGLIARMTRDHALAEELAQDTLVKAYRRLATFDTTRRLSSWLFRIAHNTALDALRRKPAPETALDAPDGSPREPAAPAQPDPVERASLGRALEEAMGALRPEFRAAIVLRYDEGLPFEEIAQVLGVPEATARSHVHRARKALARELTRAGWAPGR
jgi:RNA polymerase sigma-70 factor (ECF subfamily)